MKRIDKENIPRLLEGLSREYRVLAPVWKDQGECLFDRFEAGSFTLDYAKPPLPPKQALLPQSERIFSVGEGKYVPAPHGERTLLFGIRACDMTALLQTRSFMSKDFTDPFVEARAQATVTVVMACPGPQSPTCFCTTTRSGPWARAGFDLQLYDADDHLLVEAGSPAGEEIASGPLFGDAGPDGDARALAFKREAEEQIPVVKEIREAMDRLQDGAVGDEVWEAFGRKCITCGGCTFVCPTCTCFTIHDRVTGPGSGERLRTWDACLYAGFTREASGHNPRKTQALRLKRRHEHKLLYWHDRDTAGALCTCVGCGRCSDFCPVHIGTLEVARSAAGATLSSPLRRD